MLLYVIAPK